MIDLIPKYYKTPRTIPVMGIDGKADYVKINQQDGVDMFYDTNVLNVKVEAGVSFQIQKNRALEQLSLLMKTSPLFDRFMNEKGLPVLLDNIEIRGIDQLKLMVEDWLQELQKEKEMAQKQAQEQAQNNPMMMKNQLEMAKVQMKGQEIQMKGQVHQAQFQLDLQQLKQDQMKILGDLSMARDTNLTQRIKAETERFAKQVDLKLKNKDMHHKHFKEAIETHHMVHNKPKEAQTSVCA
jgi:uncharacterized protein YeaO (DUF488 family)